ncbi:MAG: hypothetical protein N3D76_03035 [Geminocystis sp.]|nr:hypothetical protein [Geminocystis sp.]HIK37239.1 hypothetical protein [Geminocystis sp. M7585_C2015_104]
MAWVFRGPLIGWYLVGLFRKRLSYATAGVVVTADGGWRKDNIVPLKDQVDITLADDQVSSARLLVVKRTRRRINMCIAMDHHLLSLDRFMIIKPYISPL